MPGTSNIKKDFVNSVLKTGSKTKERCSAGLETLFLDMNSTIELLDEAHAFLDVFLQRRKEIDEEIRLREEAKKKKKKKGEEETEEEGDEEDAGDEGEEEEGEKAPKFVSTILGYEEKLKGFVSQMRKSISDAKITKENAKEISSRAKEDTSDSSFSEKLMKARIDLFITNLRTEDVEKALSNISNAKKSYQLLMEKVIPSLSDTEFASSSEVSAIDKSSFIDSYSKMKEYAKNQKEEYIRSMGPGVLNTIKRSFNDVYSALFTGLHEFYFGMLDKQLLLYIKKYKKLHSKCLRDVHWINRVMGKQTTFLNKKARKSIEKINELVSK